MPPFQPSFVFLSFLGPISFPHIKCKEKKFLCFWNGLISSPIYIFSPPPLLPSRYPHYHSGGLMKSDPRARKRRAISIPGPEGRGEGRQKKLLLPYYAELFWIFMFSPPPPFNERRKISICLSKLKTILRGILKAGFFSEKNYQVGYKMHFPQAIF